MRARHNGVRSRTSVITTGGAAALLFLLTACSGGSAAHTSVSGPDPDSSSSASAEPITGASPGSSSKPAAGTSGAPKASRSPSTNGTSTTSGSSKTGSTGGGGTGGTVSSAPTAGVQDPASAGIVVNSKCRKPASSVGNGVALKGSKPPPFTATTVDCKSFDFAAFTNGKPTVVNFYASWCEPCHKEAKDLESVYKEWNAKNGLEVVGVETQDEDGNASWFYKNAGYTFQSVYDDGEKIEHAWSKASGAISTLPATFFIHADGTISSIQVGEMSHSQMEDEINKL